MTIQHLRRLHQQAGTGIAKPTRNSPWHEYVYAVDQALPHLLDIAEAAADLGDFPQRDQKQSLDEALARLEAS